MSEHKCHAIGCETSCAPEFLMCRPHWALVPKKLQVEVWRNYRPGQCNDKRPSREYLEAAKAAIRSVALKEGRLPKDGQLPLFQGEVHEREQR